MFNTKAFEEFSGLTKAQAKRRLNYYIRDLELNLCFGRQDGEMFVRDENNPSLILATRDYMCEEEALPYYDISAVFRKDLKELRPVVDIEGIILVPMKDVRDDDKYDCNVLSVNEHTNTFVFMTKRMTDALILVDDDACLCRPEDIVEFDGKKLSRRGFERDTFVCPECGKRLWLKNEVIIADGKDPIYTHHIDIRGQRLCNECAKPYIESDDYFKMLDTSVDVYVKKSLGFYYYGKWYTNFQKRHDFQRSDSSGRLVLDKNLICIESDDGDIKWVSKSYADRSPDIVKLKGVDGYTNYKYKKNCKLIDGKYYTESSCPIYSYHEYEGFRPLYIDEDGNMKKDRINSKRTFYGFEIETEGTKYSSVNLVKNVGDLVVCERDSSLKTGYEIISQPMTFECFEYVLPRLDKAFKKLAENGQTSDSENTCGLHIHVSKKAFKGDYAIMKAVAIVSFFRENIEKFSRRKENDYCIYDKIACSDNKLQRLDKRARRHSAVNTSELADRSTIEFRTFRGTLNILTLMASIELVRNIVAEANKKGNTISFNDLLIGKYIPEYIKQNNIEFDLESKVEFTDWSCYMEEGDCNLHSYY